VTEKPHEGLPVAGYQPQSEANVAAVNGFKQLEEQVLRALDDLEDNNHEIDRRLSAIGRTGIQTAFMAINRSIFKPSRIA